MSSTVRILAIKKITPNVLQIKTEKPSEFTFIPGQATEISINKEGWEDEKRPFTFTSLPQDEQLEFTIKSYPSHKGVTNQLLELQIGDELILHDVFGTIAFIGEGIFIAGGAGVTPFISILRDLESKGEIGNNKLIFANDQEADIILKEEFKGLLNDNFINILSREEKQGYENGYITRSFLQKHIPSSSSHIYLCGPPPMMDAVEEQLEDLHIPEEQIVKESF